MPFFSQYIQNGIHFFMYDHQKGIEKRKIVLAKTEKASCFSIKQEAF